MREKEALDALVASASLGANLETLSKEYVCICRQQRKWNYLYLSALRIETYKATSAAHAIEREEQVSSTLNRSSWTYLIECRNISKLLSLQNTINSRDKEIATLKSDTRALKESKEDLRVL